MKASKNNFRIVAASLGITAPLWLLSGVAHAENFSNPSVAGYWLESTFDAGGTEGVNAFGAPTVSGGQLVGAVPTDTPTWPNSAGGGQGYEAVEHLSVANYGGNGAGAYYAGNLLGNLTAKTGLTATFSLSDSLIPAGQAFTASEFGGEDAQGNQGIRLYFKSSTANDPGAPAYGGLSEWWYSPSPALVTGLSNGDAATLTADFTNLSGWSEIQGLSASSSPTETAAFESALSQVTSLGLSFGSGTYYSDGFGFNTGGTASINLDSINTTVPEPASFSLLGIGALALLRRRRRAQQ
ncbi:MAG: PEP-CTERM sorting domain-containing protein [Tepidisphaeraceae bacterium]